MINFQDFFWEHFKKTPGALSCTEAIAIAGLASKCKEGVYLELGTHKGKSAMAACCGLKHGRFYLVDPIFSDPEIEKNVFLDVELISAKSNVSLSLIPKESTDVIETMDGYSYVMVDSGSHGDGLPMTEAKMLEDRMIPGGIIVFHDFGNQFREPKEAAEYLVSTGKYVWVDIDLDAIREYVSKNDLEKGNNSWHIYEDHPMPGFVGAVKKV